MTNLGILKSNLESILQDDQNLFSKIERKFWIYKINTLVLDFKLDGEKYAYDFYFKENILCIDFINRSSGFKKNISSDGGGVGCFVNHFNDLIKKYDFIISIVIPVYNRENLIDKCIDSINQQKTDFSIFEVLFIDDFSSDNSIKVIKDRIDKRVNYKILERPINSGSASAPRNDGIKASRGEFILFLDSDDYLYDYTINDLINIVVKENPDVTYLKIDGDKGRAFGIRPYKKGDVFNANIHDNHLLRSLMPSKLIRKSLIMKNNIYFPVDIKVGEDRVFLIQVLSKSKKISILANKPYYYLVNHDQNRLTFVYQSLEQDIEIVSRTLKYISRANMSLNLRRKFFSSWMNVILESYVKNRIKNSKHTKNEKKQYIKEVIKEYNFYSELHDDSCIYNEFKELYINFISSDIENLFLLSEK